MPVLSDEESAAARSGSAERVVAAATELFAQSGFDGVSTRQIAAATGLNISTVHHHTGSKRELYQRVIEQMFRQEEQLVDAILGDIDDAVMQDAERLTELLRGLIDSLLQFARKNPSRQRLYLQRWLEPKDELSQREAELTLRLYRRLAGVLKRAQAAGVVRADVDVGYFLRSCDWLIFSYFVSGAFNWRTLRGDPLRSENVARFRDYLIDHLKQMLEL